MSAEFNLIGNQNPSFFIHFKPDFGGFSLKKSHSSEFVKGLGEKLNGNVTNGNGKDFLNNGYFKGGGLFPSSEESKAAAGFINGLLKGTEVSARTALPVKDVALLNFRWGLRVPKLETAAAEDADHTVMVAKRGNRNTGIGLPILVMNKIGIEQVTISKPEEEKTKYTEVADVFFEVKKQLELIQDQNGLMSKALCDLRSDIVAGKMDFLPYDRNKVSGGGVDRRGTGGKKSSKTNGFGTKSPFGEGKN